MASLLSRALLTLNEHGFTPATLISSLVNDSHLHGLPAIVEIQQCLPEWNQKLGLSLTTEQDWTKAYEAEVRELLKIDTGFHCPRSKITEEHLCGFNMDEISDRLAEKAPRLWKLMDNLLDVDSPARYMREFRARKRQEKKRKAKAALLEGEDSDSESGDEEFEPRDGEDEIDEDDIRERRDRLLKIKKAVCISIMLHSSNQQCNRLQVAVGVYLHATNTPESVRQLLSRFGVSVSTSTINKAISRLSKDAEQLTNEIGRALLALYAYDNLDSEIKHAVPVVERSQETLVHFTTGTMLPLAGNITLDDLRCSYSLWSISPNNRNRVLVPEKLPIDLMFSSLHPETVLVSGLRRRQRFFKWKFLYDLVFHGPEYFRRYRGQIGQPEVIDAIPIVKDQPCQRPLKTLPIHPTGAPENARALESFLRQGGLSANQVDGHVVLVSGDLLTGERLRSLLESRQVEKDAWDRFQHVIFVMGLFHLKMACADAIWRIFVSSSGAAGQSSPNSLISHVAQIRPRETGKVLSQPGFRRMHDVIQHVGIVSRLDCWRGEAKSLPDAPQSLEALAALKPSWQDLEALAEQIVFNYVKTGDHVGDLREEDDSERDQVHENILLRNHYFLLYEEISYAMDHGDIGRVETCFVPWSAIFQGCGKFKYAAELQRYIEDVHYRYPSGLKKAIRMNILRNPTGKPGHFRAIDWIVEHNNLYIKRIYSGQFSNRTPEHIMNQSVLIEVFKSVRIQFENWFCFPTKSVRHSPANLKRTFAKLGKYMEDHHTNGFIANRTDIQIIPDVLSKGMANITHKKGVAEQLEEDGLEVHMEEEDLMI